MGRTPNFLKDTLKENIRMIEQNIKTNQSDSRLQVMSTKTHGRSAEDEQTDESLIFSTEICVSSQTNNIRCDISSFDSFYRHQKEFKYWLKLQLEHGN